MWSARRTQLWLEGPWPQGLSGQVRETGGVYDVSVRPWTVRALHRPRRVHRARVSSLSWKNEAHLHLAPLPVFTDSGSLPRCRTRRASSARGSSSRTPCLAGSSSCVTAQLIVLTCDYARMLVLRAVCSRAGDRGTRPLLGLLQVPTPTVPTQNTQACRLWTCSILDARRSPRCAAWAAEWGLHQSAWFAHSIVLVSVVTHSMGAVRLLLVVV